MDGWMEIQSQLGFLGTPTKRMRLEQCGHGRILREALRNITDVFLFVPVNNLVDSILHQSSDIIWKISSIKVRSCIKK
jgi:hypothetical protein